MQERLKNLLVTALVELLSDTENPATADQLHEQIIFEIPRDRTHGDLACNIAMRMAKPFGKPPRQIAEMIVAQLGSPEGIADIAIAGPGFINFTFDTAHVGDGLKEILLAGDDFGRHHFGNGIKVNIEFSSVNPTGPISVGHGRQAVLGDALARIMRFCGYEVTREYYANDTGRQIEKLGESIIARAYQQNEPDHPFPEDGYHGDYIIDLAKLVMAEKGVEFLTQEDAPLQAGIFAKKILLEDIRSDCRALGVEHEVVYSEESLHAAGLVMETLEDLEKRDLVYEKDGAKWLRATDFGDEKDRVMVRSEGTPTYALNDAAYHRTKVNRNFDEIIDIFGADHHGYMPRLRALVLSLGFPKDKFTILIHQFVNVLRDGKMVRMSKRAATFITLKELLEEVGADVIRYYFLERKMDAQVDFDIEEACRRSMDNPVYYLQYCHARCSSILREAQKKGFDVSLEAICAEDFNKLASRLDDEREQGILKKCHEFGAVVERTCRQYSPHVMITFGQELARLFQSYYTAGKMDVRYRVVVEDRDDTMARLALTQGVRIVIHNLLTVLGMSAPERM